MSTTILYVRPRGGGWGPITAMARLLAPLLEAQLIEVEDRSLSRAARLRALGPRLRGGDTLLVIAAVPEMLTFIGLVPGIRRRYGTVVGWVIDSWWTDRIPGSVTRGRLYDRLLVTEKEVVLPWAEATGLPVEWMPLGADVLGSIRSRGWADSQSRGIDLQRMGRQPAAWEDDDAVGRLSEERGLSYGPRPPVGASHEESYANALDADAAARSVLAFTNLASPGDYTHPTREYVTSRWLDALAQGALVVGRRPREEGSDRLLWDEASLEVPADDPGRGLSLLREALEAGGLPRPREVQAEALRRLDWRWRAQDLVEILGVRSARLSAEMSELDALAERGATPGT